MLMGCASVDLDKGREIAKLSLGESSAHSIQVDLPEGSAEVVIAVADGKCNPVNEDTTVDIALRSNGLSINRTMRMGDLTWAYAVESCDAYGYLYDASRGVSKPFEVRSASYEAVIRVRPGIPEQRMASVWMIYGGRAPLIRMFAAHRKAA